MRDRGDRNPADIIIDQAQHPVRAALRRIRRGKRRIEPRTDPMRVPEQWPGDELVDRYRNLSGKPAFSDRAAERNTART